MSVPLRTLLCSPPLTQGGRVTFERLPGTESHRPLTSDKAWARNYDPIAQQYISWVVNPTLEMINTLYGEEDSLEQTLLDKLVHPVNETNHMIQSERDGGFFFDTYVSHPVQFAFSPILVRRSEAGPLGTTNSAQTVDLAYSHGDVCVLCGEFKKHGILSVPRWIGEKDHDTNRTRIGREIRG